MFDAYPDYYAHVTAHYDGTPFFDGGGISDSLDWAKISISPPTPVDIKPGSCKNPVNVKSQGVLPVVVMGTDLLDVTMIDPSTILLEGVPPLRWALEDVGSPMGEPEEGEEPDCSAGETPDGMMDLVLKFSTQAILAAIGPVEDGDLVPLILTGDTEDFPVIGQDVITIIKRGRIRVSEDDDGDDPGDGGRDGDNGLHNGWTNGNGNAYGRDRDEHPGLRRGHNKSNDEGEEAGSEDAEESGSSGSGNGNGQGKDKDKGEKAGGNNGNGNGADKGNGNKNGHNNGGD
jgi:hypothetical protein